MASDRIPLTISVPSACLGEDLCVEILERLPVEAICRFRCVSKGWNALISSPSFIKSHHNYLYSYSTGDMKQYLRFTLGDRCPDSHTFCNDSYSLYLPQEDEHVGFGLHFPFRGPGDDSGVYFTFVDVINGVVCMTYSTDSSFDTSVLWNFAINKYVALPHLSFPSHLQKAESDFAHVENFGSVSRFESNGIGFGYDSSKNEFKVVRIWIPSSSIQSVYESLPLTYEVYSSREGVWRTAIADNIVVNNLQFDAARRRTSCFVNGTIHWRVTNNDSSIHSVVMFDCEHEKFRTMELPMEIYREEGTKGSCNPCRVEILQYAGKLSVVVEFFLKRYLELWVMDEPDVASSWKIFFRLPSYCALSLDCICICQPSLELPELYGPLQWVEFAHEIGRFQLILTCHLYDQSLFLMDDPKARSYEEDEIVQIGRKLT